eukprot:NODE_1601_length_577_cov_213.709251_g1587_i0.p1 GENE.NODE_1601_length_577_cov_213.709251_g1587_i0~~NODE_1601_length_577_cov_213.709251_g1587_i0.p1  ORF type:complete len:168 (-),score=38.63 NODE_1601_length_577_cov_213.709251_g1587_i0:72-545(-)
MFGDDLGGMTAPLISVKTYKELFKDRHGRMWRRAKELCPHIKVKLHCCGSVRKLLGDLVDAGLDAINPVQTSARNMDPATLKAEFGDKMVFWGGGCNTHRTLPFGTPEQVKENVKENCAIFNPGGGFVFQQVHNILHDVPPENIIAMYDALRELRES